MHSARRFGRSPASAISSGQFAIALLCALASVFAHADPWLEPGDQAVRSDIQLLADAGIVRGPTTTWPMSWPDVARDVQAAEASGLDAATADALMRVQRRARAASTYGFGGGDLRISAARDAGEIRSFADSPRSQGELGLRASWLTDHLALNLQGAYVVDPKDGQQFRADGSYLGVNVANFMLSAGLMERWWGPGWDGSLILSSNARPIPSLTLERNYTDPFRSKWLSWIGPWRASIAIGRAESSGVPVKDVRFFAARVNFKPRPWLEFGLSRTAQWCGRGRPCGSDIFLDMLLGRDNQVAGGTVSLAQPGNQMAGYDMRLRSPWKSLPLAFYTQWIGEDEAGGLPSKFLGQLGLETWGSSAFGGWRLRGEYTDTTCNFTRRAPEFGCAYRNSIYPQGYAYREQTIGDPMDNDSRRFSLAAQLNMPQGQSVSLSMRHFQINRDGGSHPISQAPLDFNNVELRLSRVFGAGRVTLGLGYNDRAMPGVSSPLHGFATWQQGL